jgi:hypothetical protein
VLLQQMQQLVELKESVRVMYDISTVGRAHSLIFFTILVGRDAHVAFVSAPQCTRPAREHPNSTGAALSLPSWALAVACD